MLLWSPGASTNKLHPGDDEKAKWIARETGNTSIMALPTSKLTDLIAAIACCDLMICADGGAMHIAAALGKPIICMFGDSTVSRWHPWHVRYQAIQPQTRDVKDITVDQVLEAVRMELDPSKNG
jgi:ADP-heptose:LPS heptosyltransferase